MCWAGGHSGRLCVDLKVTMEESSDRSVTWGELMEWTRRQSSRRSSASDVAFNLPLHFIFKRINQTMKLLKVRYIDCDTQS